jgi:hypothetical protein
MCFSFCLNTTRITLDLLLEIIYRTNATLLSIADLIIDGYASGYNHGFFNGIETIINGGPFFQSPAIYK